MTDVPNSMRGVEALYTPVQAAKILKTTPRNIRYACQRGEIGRKIGSSWVLTQREVEQFLVRPRGNPGWNALRKPAAPSYWNDLPQPEDPPEDDEVLIGRKKVGG